MAQLKDTTIIGNLKVNDINVYEFINSKEWKPLEYQIYSDKITVYSSGDCLYRYDGYSLEIYLMMTIVTKRTINNGEAIITLENLPINIDSSSLKHIMAWDATLMKCVKFELKDNEIYCEHSNSSTSTFCNANTWFAVNAHIMIPISQ